MPTIHPGGARRHSPELYRHGGAYRSAGRPASRRAKKRGEMENTLVVYSSDHGEMLGDHNRWGKVLPYHASASVPMVITGPGVQDGVVSVWSPLSSNTHPRRSLPIWTAVR